MALSMPGLRVRVYDDGDPEVRAGELQDLLEEFDALVDVPLASGALSAAIARKEVSFLVEAGAILLGAGTLEPLPFTRTVVLSGGEPGGGSWEPLCGLLGLAQPVEAFPAGAHRVRDSSVSAARMRSGDLPNRLGMTIAR